VNLTPSLRQEAEATGEVMHGSGEYAGRGHWNARAHEVVAESLGKWLCSEWLLPGSEPTADPDSSSFE
jgi:hypothetical protein